MYQDYTIQDIPRILERKDLPFPGKTVVAIGNFDGVHIGHRALLTRLADLISTQIINGSRVYK